MHEGISRRLVSLDKFKIAFGHESMASTVLLYNGFERSGLFQPCCVSLPLSGFEPLQARVRLVGIGRFQLS